jgi:hypothetical protein
MQTATATTTATTARPRRRRGPSRRMLAALVLAAVLAAGAAYAAVTLTRGAEPLEIGTPTVLSAEDAAAVAGQVGHDVYGVGEQPGTRLEVTLGSGGEVWVRYLSGDARAGDDRAEFVTVGTYRDPRALDAAREAAADGGSRSAELPGGGLMLWSLERPTSVYVARPGSDLLVEVYSPDAEQARSLARSGAVVPLR